jgi:hypothetical protein
MSRWVAVLGEIEENPLVLGFEEQEARLARVLGELNRDFAAELRAPLTTSSSFPELSAALVDLSSAYPLARRLAEEFHPLSVRMAAAAGEVLDPPTPSQGILFPGETPPAAGEPEPPEGPAFDLAAELLYLARKEDRLLVIEGAGTVVDRLANALFLVLCRAMQRWTERQCEVVRLYRALRRQREVAEALGVTQQSVSSSLSAAGWKTLEDVEAVVRTVLARPGVAGGSAPSHPLPQGPDAPTIKQ